MKALKGIIFLIILFGMVATAASSKDITAMKAEIIEMEEKLSRVWQVNPGQELTTAERAVRTKEEIDLLRMRREMIIKLTKALITPSVISATAGEIVVRTSPTIANFIEVQGRNNSKITLNRRIEGTDLIVDLRNNASAVIAGDVVFQRATFYLEGNASLRIEGEVSGKHLSIISENNSSFSANSMSVEKLETLTEDNSEVKAKVVVAHKLANFNISENGLVEVETLWAKKMSLSQLNWGTLRVNSNINIRNADVITYRDKHLTEVYTRYNADGSGLIFDGNGPITIRRRLWLPVDPNAFEFGTSVPLPAETNRVSVLLEGYAKVLEDIGRVEQKINTLPELFKKDLRKIMESSPERTHAETCDMAALKAQIYIDFKRELKNHLEEMYAIKKAVEVELEKYKLEPVPHDPVPAPPGRGLSPRV